MELSGPHSNAQQTNYHVHHNYIFTKWSCVNEVDNNLHYKKHMLNLPAILNHEEERATILAELWFKEKKVDSSIDTGILFYNRRDNYKLWLDC